MFAFFVFKKLLKHCFFNKKIKLQFSSYNLIIKFSGLVAKAPICQLKPIIVLDSKAYGIPIFALAIFSPKSYAFI